MMRIERLEIDDLRSIKRLRWPEDGLGWGGRIPDVVIVAGANGSGKTTLLNEIFEYIHTLLQLKDTIKHYKENNIQFKIFRDTKRNKNQKLDIIINTNKTIIKDDSSLEEILNSIDIETSKVIYFKSKRSNPKISSRGSKDIHNIPEASHYQYTWDEDQSNDISIEKLCYSARWEDANSFLNGHPEKAIKFNFYADEFERFTEGEKRLVWSDEGVLLVETRDGVRHDVNELSSGEHQALIFTMMLSRWWAPGSIVLIDEPELHMHTHWQAKLLQRIIDLQRERGGQAILATQSSDLFAMAPQGSQVLLGSWR